MAVDLQIFNGTPAFVIKSTDAKYQRVAAATFDKKNGRWLFAAYPPFGLLVTRDLRIVDANAVYTPAAQAQVEYLQQVPRLLEERVLPEGYKFHTKPFDHQVWGLCLLHYFPRFALWWDPGVGKSKVPLDLLRLHGAPKTLILSQKVTLENWVEQAAVHAPGLRAAALIGTPEQKIDVIANHAQYDVLVASYGTARNLGLPRLHKEALARMKTIEGDAGASRKMTRATMEALARIARRLVTPEAQVEVVDRWLQGETYAQLDAFVSGTVAATPQWLDDVPYTVCLVDESQNIKKSEAQQTKTIIELGKKASHRYCLSGTPTSGDPRHIYPQMRFLSPAILPEDWLRFSDLFLVRSQWNKRIVTGFKNLHILNERVNRVSDTKKKDACLTLPPRTVTDIRVPMSPTQTRAYNQLVGGMTIDLASFFANPTQHALEVQHAAALLNKLSQVTSGFVIDRTVKTTLCDACPHLTNCVTANILPHTELCQISKKAPQDSVNFFKDNPKLDAFEELLDTLLEDETRKVIVWAYFQAELDLIQAALDRRGLGYERMDGGATNIQAKITRFNTQPKCRVYLGQINTGVGITLNAAEYMIYFSVDWKLDVYLQSIDRNYRAGQDKKVTVYRLIAKDTVEEYKYVALDQKKDLSATLTNKLSCVTCPQRIDCLNKGIELFDKGCIHQRTVKRTVAKAETLE